MVLRKKVKVNTFILKIENIINPSRRYSIVIVVFCYLKNNSIVVQYLVDDNGHTLFRLH